MKGIAFNNCDWGTPSLDLLLEDIADGGGERSLDVGVGFTPTLVAIGSTDSGSRTGFDNIGAIVDFAFTAGETVKDTTMLDDDDDDTREEIVSLKPNPA